MKITSIGIDKLHIATYTVKYGNKTKYRYQLYIVYNTSNRRNNYIEIPLTGFWFSYPKHLGI